MFSGSKSPGELLWERLLLSTLPPALKESDAVDSGHGAEGLSPEGGKAQSVNKQEEERAMISSGGGGDGAEQVTFIVICCVHHFVNIIPPQASNAVEVSPGQGHREESNMFPDHREPGSAERPRLGGPWPQRGLDASCVQSSRTQKASPR